MPRKAKKNGGFIENVVIKKFKTTDHLIARIVHHQELSTKVVTRMMQYNVFTVDQICKLTGLPPNNIHTRLRGYIKGIDTINYSINSCDPFDGSYARFIYRNQKCQDLIEKCNGYERASPNQKTARDTEFLTPDC